MSPDTVLVPQPTLDDFPDFVSIPVRVARNAKAWPDKIAVMCEGAISGFLERSRFSEHNILQLAVGNRLQ